MLYGVKKIRFRTRKISDSLSLTQYCLSTCQKSTPAKRKYVSFFFNNAENECHAAENVSSVYTCSPDTETANYSQFRFRRFRSGNINVKYAGRPIVESTVKITKIVRSDRHVSPSFGQKESHYIQSGQGTHRLWLARRFGRVGWKFLPIHLIVRIWHQLINTCLCQ